MCQYVYNLVHVCHDQCATQMEVKSDRMMRIKGRCVGKAHTDERMAKHHNRGKSRIWGLISKIAQ